MGSSSTRNPVSHAGRHSTKKRIDVPREQWLISSKYQISLRWIGEDDRFESAFQENARNIEFIRRNATFLHRFASIFDSSHIEIPFTSRYVLEVEFSPILYHLLISRAKETEDRNRFDSCCKRMPRENGAIARNANDWQDRCNWIKRWRRMTRRCELARSTRIGAERSGEDEAPARGEPAIRKIFKPIGWYF